MKSLGPAWWGGLLIGLFVGVFVTALLVETEAVPASSPAWKFIRGGSALAVALTAIIGNWGLKKARAESNGAINSPAE